MAAGQTTTPVVAAPSPSLVNILNYFNTYAAAAAAVIQQEQADISQGNHVAAVNDAVAGAAATIATVMPTQATNVQLAFNAFTFGESLVQSIVKLFHKTPKTVVPAVNAVATK